MLDQCHNIEQKIPGQIRSVLNVQEMTARALLVDRVTPCSPRRRPATSSAPTRCSWTPSPPTSAPTSPPAARAAACRAHPMRAYAGSGHQAELETTRVGGTQMSWT